MAKRINKRELHLTRVELIEHQLVDILKPTGMVVNDTELKVLAYVFLYGREAIYKASDAGLGNTKSIENILTKYRKKGLVHGIRNNTKLHPEIKPIIADEVTYEVIIKLKDE